MIAGAYVTLPKVEVDEMGECTVQFVIKELVLCKDCMNLRKLPLDNHGYQPYWCDNLNIYSEGLDWFCADGVKRDE